MSNSEVKCININKIPKYITNMASNFDIDGSSLDNNEYRTYLFKNVPLCIINTLRRIIINELRTFAYNKDTFTNFTNNTQINNEVVKDQMEFSSIFSGSYYNQNTIKTYYGASCTATPQIGTGYQHSKWQVFNSYLKYVTEYDLLDFIEDDNIYGHIDIGDFEDIEDIEDKENNKYETLKQQRKYIKTSNGEPKYVLLTIEKNKENDAILDENDIVIENGLDFALKISIKNLQNILFNNVRSIIPNTNHLLEDINTPTIGYLLQESICNTTFTFKNNQLYINMNNDEEYIKERIYYLINITKNIDRMI